MPEVSCGLVRLSYGDGDTKRTREREAGRGGRRLGCPRGRREAAPEGAGKAGCRGCEEARAHRSACRWSVQCRSRSTTMVKVSSSKILTSGPPNPTGDRRQPQIAAHVHFLRTPVYIHRTRPSSSSIYQSSFRTSYVPTGPTDPTHRATWLLQRVINNAPIACAAFEDFLKVGGIGVPPFRKSPDGVPETRHVKSGARRGGGDDTWKRGRDRRERHSSESKEVGRVRVRNAAIENASELPSVQAITGLDQKSPSRSPLLKRSSSK